jgi:hypothetical protein
MNFNFHEFRKPRIQRLFIPLNAFSFAAFIVPIKFRQPIPVRVISAQRRAWPFGMNRPRLDGPAN